MPTSEKSLFWTTGATGDGASPYTQADIIAFFGRMFAPGQANAGIVKNFGDELEVTGTASPVSVAAGGAMVYGFPYLSDAAVTVAIPTPAASTRIDRIVLRADWAAQTVRITRIAGTEGAGAPALTQNPGVTYDVPLAQVSITTAGAITVTDEREFCHFGTAVGPDNIDDEAVETEHIKDGAVTADKMATGAALPIGALMPYAGAAAPSGWLLCDGSAVSRSTYAGLFAVIGTTYGAGNGTTTFNVPNLKGRMPVGLDAAHTEFDTLAETGGEITHTLTEAEMPNHGHVLGMGGSHTHTEQGAGAHTHTTSDPGNHTHLTQVGTGAEGGDPRLAVMGQVNRNALQTGADTATTAAGAHTHTTSDPGNHSHTIDAGGSHTHSMNNVGGGTAHPNLQPYIVMPYIVKY